jgi:HAE1 family hydrophobic/amphiphilic exporter-1
MLIRLAVNIKMLTNYETDYFIKQRIEVRLKDIADVQDAQKMEKLLVFKSAIVLQIVKQSDANAVAVSEQLVKTIATLENDYKSNEVKLQIAKDSTVFLLEAADSVLHTIYRRVVALVMLFSCIVLEIH